MFYESRIVWKLQREKQPALNKILESKQELYAKQNLELEVQQLKGKLEVMKIQNQRIELIN